MHASDLPVPAAIEWLDSVGSTNEEALARGAAGTPGPLWIAAREQTGGRGRNGRHWQSPRGNLYASLLLTFPHPFPAVPQLALVAGLAAHDAVRAFAPNLPLAIKWPNDLIVGSAKLAGILIEGRTSPAATGQAVAAGFGINLAEHPQLLGRETTALIAHGIEATPDEALRHLSRAASRWLAAWADGSGFGAIREAWLARAIAIGTALTVHTDKECLSGLFLGLDPDGAMRLGLPAGGERRVTFGDVNIDARAAARS